MDPRTQPLRDEHRALQPELAALRIAADTVGTPAASDNVERAHRLLVRHLLPHMAAEEATLYPAIDQLSGSDATAPMRRDHDEIRRLTARLQDLRGAHDGDPELRAALDALDALVRLHLVTEEERYYPRLDEHLDNEHAVAVITALHEVERDLLRGIARIEENEH